MNAYYRLYIKSCIRLAATLRIKDSYTARAINEKLSLLGFTVDANVPSSWKYYLNLAGIYHESDTMMQVISIDSRTVIDFTRENLAVHRGTRSAYSYGSTYYHELIAKYPGQESLIKGILNPIDIQTAIDAEDHKILFYDKKLVEEREVQLIPQLQQYISQFFVRWYNPDYSLFEPYYYPGLLGVLYTKLPMEIVLIRKAACRTDMVHSYHIRQFLSSFSQVGAEFDYMTDKLRLWLYRNIRYLNRNIGSQEIFEKVTEKVLTDRGYSLAGYEVNHNYEELSEEVEPRIEFIREVLNGIEPAAGKSRKTAAEVLELESKVARDNPIYKDDTETSVNKAAKRSLFNRLKTKVLESNVLDRTESEPYRLADILLNHWLFFSHIGLYTSSISFTNPRKGDTYRLNAKDAFILYLYAYNKSVGITLSTIPSVIANRVMRLSPPSFEELRSLSTPDKVSDEWIEYIIESQPTLTNYVSIESFKEACVEIQNTMLTHRTLRHMANDYIMDGQLHTLMDRCYMDFGIQLGDGITYDQWFSNVSMDLSELTGEEFAIMADEIITAATGRKYNVAEDGKAIHAAMIRIMRALSSYTVQYIEEINGSPLIVLAGKFPKLTVPKIKTVLTQEFETELPQARDLKLHEGVYTPVESETIISRINFRDELISAKVPVRVDASLKVPQGIAYPVELRAPTVTLKDPEIKELPTTGEAEDLEVHISYPANDFLKAGLVYENDTVRIDGYGSLSDARRRLFLNIL